MIGLEWFARLHRGLDPGKLIYRFENTTKNTSIKTANVVDAVVLVDLVLIGYDEFTLMSAWFAFRTCIPALIDEGHEAADDDYGRYVWAMNLHSSEALLIFSIAGPARNGSL